MCVCFKIWLLRVSSNRIEGINFSFRTNAGQDSAAPRGKLVRFLSTGEPRKRWKQKERGGSWRHPFLLRLMLFGEHNQSLSERERERESERNIISFVFCFEESIEYRVFLSSNTHTVRKKPNQNIGQEKPKRQKHIITR